MIFGFIKRVQENITKDSSTSSSTETYSEADQSALMASYEDAVLICESLEASMVRSSVASAQLFGESVQKDSEELYIASMFDKAKGLFVSIWKVIVDAFKAVTNWIKGLFGKVTKASSRNFEQIDKICKLNLLKITDLGSPGTGWTIPSSHKFEYKRVGAGFAAVIVAYKLWSKGQFDKLKLDATHTAGNIFKEKMQKGVTDAVVALLNNDDNGITPEKVKAITDTGKEIDTTINALRSDNLSGMTGDGASKKAKQLKYFLGGLLFSTADSFFNRKDWKERGVENIKATEEEFKALVDAFAFGADGEDMLFTSNTDAEIGGIVTKAMQLIEAGGLTNIDLNTYLKNGTNSKVGKAILIYLRMTLEDSASKFMNIPEDSGDVKAYLIKSIFEDRIPMQVSKDNNFNQYVSEVVLTMAAMNSWIKGNSVSSIKNKLEEGEKFFSNIAKEYQVIYDQMKKVVDNNTNISSRPKMSEITNGLNSMVRSAGELTSWFTTGIIQTYAVGDMMMSKGAGEMLMEFSRFSNILEKVAVKVGE